MEWRSIGVMGKPTRLACAGGIAREKVRIVAHFSPFYAQIRAVVTRFYAFLRVGLFFQ